MDINDKKEMTVVVIIMIIMTPLFLYLNENMNDIDYQCDWLKRGDAMELYENCVDRTLFLKSLFDMVAILIPVIGILSLLFRFRRIELSNKK